MTSPPRLPARPPPAARAVDLTKVYGSGDTQVVALDAVSVRLRARPVHRHHGPVRLGQVDPDALPRRPRRRHRAARSSSATPTSPTLDDKRLTRLRRDAVGFIFQAFNLLPTLTAIENITLPMDIAGRKPDQEWLDTVIDRIGLRDRLTPPADRALRRPAAAGRLRPRAGQPAGDHLRRRADRQPRQRQRRRGARLPAPVGDATWTRRS